MRAAEPLIKADTNCLTQYLETLKAAEAPAPTVPAAEAPATPTAESPAAPPAETPTPAKPKRKGKVVATVIEEAEAAAATEANKDLVPA